MPSDLVGMTAFIIPDLVNRVAREKDRKMEMKLYVGNLAYSTSEDALRNLFGQAGSVTSAELIKDRYTGESKGFAFVQMGTQSEAEKAISMFNGYSLDNREIKVSVARPREDSGRGGFGGNRNDSYGRKPRKTGGYNNRY